VNEVKQSPLTIDRGVPFSQRQTQRSTQDDGKVFELLDPRVPAKGRQARG